MEAAAADPVLRASSERAFRASFLHWATQNLQHPGASVGPGLGDEVVYIARDLIRRGLEGDGHNRLPGGTVAGPSILRR